VDFAVKVDGAVWMAATDDSCPSNDVFDPIQITPSKNLVFPQRSDLYRGKAIRSSFQNKFTKGIEEGKMLVPRAYEEFTTI
jgi:hypothetical protein